MFDIPLQDDVIVATFADNITKLAIGETYKEALQITTDNINNWSTKLGININENNITKKIIDPPCNKKQSENSTRKYSKIP